MFKKIKKMVAVLLILFSTAILFVAILAIWDIIEGEVAKEAFLKIAYTFGAIIAVSSFVFFIAKPEK